MRSLLHFLVEGGQKLAPPRLAHAVISGHSHCHAPNVAVLEVVTLLKTTLVLAVMMVVLASSPTRNMFGTFSSTLSEYTPFLTKMVRGLPSRGSASMASW